MGRTGAVITRTYKSRDDLISELVCRRLYHHIQLRRSGQLAPHRNRCSRQHQHSLHDDPKGMPLTVTDARGGVTNLHLRH